MNTIEDKAMNEVLSAFVDDESTSEPGLLEQVFENDSSVAAWQSMHLVRDVIQADYNGLLPTDFASRVSNAIALEEMYEDTYEENFSGQSFVGDEAASGYRTAEVVSISRMRDRAVQSTGRVREYAEPPAAQQATVHQPFSLWKPVAGLGLAASLAGASFLFSQLWQANLWKVDQTGADSAQAGQTVASGAGAAAQDSTLTAATQQNTDLLEVLSLNAAATGGSGNGGSTTLGNEGTHWRMDDAAARNAEIEKRLNLLLTNHLEDASMGRVHGLVSHSRIVGYDELSSEQPVIELPATTDQK